MSDADQITIVPAPAPKPRVHKPNPQNNRTVSKCWRAYRRALRKGRAQNGGDNDPESEAKEAYILAMPDLSGYENIRDYIACIGFAISYNIIYQRDSDKFLSVAKLALSALDREPKPNPKCAD